MNHDGVHALQHILFIGCGVNMWMALLGPLPKPAWFGNLARLGYIVAVRLYGTILANVFVWSDRPIYDVYVGGTQRPGHRRLDHDGRGVDPDARRSAAGCSCGRRTRGRSANELMELAQERGVPLDERRAARAVSAGRGEELRRRLEAGRP